MSGMDLFEDGFPHSTREGYEGGCRGHACPGSLEHGFSCADANVRFHGDYAYQRMVREGMAPAEIAEAERPPVPVKKASAREKKNGRLLTEPTVTVADSVEPLPEPEPERVVPVRKASRGRAPIEHGTAKGYGQGCRDDCPRHPETHLTCREAMNAYLREYKARRAANGGKKLGPDGRRASQSRKLAVVPVRVKVLCRFSSEPGPKAISYLVLRNGSWVQGRPHASWAEAMEYARGVVAEYRLGVR